MNQDKPAGLGPISGVSAPLPAAGPTAVADPFRGVVFTPSDQISASLKRQVQAEFDRIGDKRALMARVDVTVVGPDGKKSTNAVIAYQSASGWQTGLYAGKSHWDKVAGVSLGKVWR